MYLAAITTHPYPEEIEAYENAVTEQEAQRLPRDFHLYRPVDVTRFELLDATTYEDARKEVEQRSLAIARGEEGFQERSTVRPAVPRPVTVALAPAETVFDIVFEVEAR